MKTGIQYSLFTLLVIAIITAHLLSEDVFMDKMTSVDEEGVALLQTRFKLDKKYRKGGYFTQAVYDGYNKFTNTPVYASRFAGNEKSCSDCHTYEDMAYAFIQLDRYDSKRQKRVSFEEQVLRCYVKELDGHPPTFFEPALQNIKIFARFMATGLALQEGSLRVKQQ
jgi:cytochrome c